MRHGPVTFALAVFAAELVSSPARAGTITFGATCESFDCPPGSFVSTSFTGSQGFGPIDFVDSYQFPITNGRINFASSSATSGRCSGFPSICTYGFGQGGTFSITGSVFGLPDGTTLISGTFRPGGTGVGEPYGASFTSALVALYINPTILTDLGLPADFTTGVGSLNVYDSGGFPWSATLTVDPSATPEPPAAVLLVSGLVALVGWKFSRQMSRDVSKSRA